MQVLINLLENGIKYSPDDTPVELQLKKKGEWAEFIVMDLGNGISNEEFPYLFSGNKPSGTKSSDSARGLGIGLSICKTIVNAHGGELTAKNRDDKGAVFRLTLPLKGSE